MNKSVKNITVLQILGIVFLYQSCIISNDDNGIFPYQHDRDSEIVRQCYQIHYKDIVSQSYYHYKHREQDAINKVEYLKNQKDSGIYVYRYNGQTVGYIQYGETQKNPFMQAFLPRVVARQLPDCTQAGMIYELGVMPEYKGKRFGEKLCQYAIDELSKKEHITFIRVITTSMEVGDKFYGPKFGFTHGFFDYASGPRDLDPCFYWKKPIRPTLRQQQQAKIGSLIRALVVRGLRR